MEVFFLVYVCGEFYKLNMLLYLLVAESLVLAFSHAHSTMSFCHSLAGFLGCHLLLVVYFLADY